MWKSITAWFASKGGFSHVVAGTWLVAVAAYGSVPAFHTLVIDMWAKTPPVFREIGLAIAGLLAWYTTTAKALTGTVDTQGNVSLTGNPVVPVALEGQKTEPKN
jgi:hypothetical protein